MKIGTFPTPHPDELLYSIIARHHMRVRVRGKKPRDTLEQLFGSRTATATYDFPCRLQDLCDRLPDGLEFTPSTIIKERTLLPFYSPFLPPERLATITTRMVQSDRHSCVHAMIGCNSTSFNGNISLTHLRYCPLCLRENQAEFGEGYWHRSHQLPGIAICHAHHVPLLKSQVQINNRCNKLIFHSLEQEFRSDDPSCLPSSTISETDLWLAKKSHWLLSKMVPSLGLNVLKERYLALLNKNGLSSPMGKIRHKEYLDRFTNFYGQQKLAEYFCDIRTKSRCCWLKNVVQKTNQALSPLQHLLLMKFLGSDPEELFFDYFEGLKPFGDGPYPCLNSVCSQYNKLAITEIKITRNTHTGHPVGNFKCEKCEFTYNRTGPDICPEDKFKRSNIINVGPVWNQELLRLNADSTQNLKQKSKRLGVDPSTIRRHLGKLKGGNKKIISVPNNLETKKIECRKILINTIRKSPNITRSGLRDEIRREFRWLYKNDHDWLYENLPNSQERLAGC